MSNVIRSLIVEQINKYSSSYLLWAGTGMVVTENHNGAWPQIVCTPKHLALLGAPRSLHKYICLLHGTVSKVSRRASLFT